MSLKLRTGSPTFTGLRAHAHPCMLPHTVLDDMDAVRTAMEPFAVLLNQGKVEYRIYFLDRLARHEISAALQPFWRPGETSG